MPNYQQRAVAHYNRKARPWVFKIRTLVLKKVFENTAKEESGSSKQIGKAFISSLKQALRFLLLSCKTSPKSASARIAPFSSSTDSAPPPHSLQPSKQWPS
ncbi:hypothetical protein CK203_110187 [Vitis vinifera]|uniref:Uncharacterized protein n=1 Tax=Vitis vinifera TaxID=29760 RepID=A0A438FHH3_VITVI|nr:hypothetical protein CK203_110187 [Vitis vinifera]